MSDTIEVTYKKLYNKEYYQKNKNNIKAYRQKNKNYIKAQKNEYRKKNKARVNELQRSHYQENKADIKAYQEKNKEHIKELRKIYYQENKNSFRESHTLWRKNNPYKAKAMSVRNRSKRPISSETIQRVYEDNIKQYGTLTCYLCLKAIPFGKDSLDHNIPISRGGSNDYANLGVAHFVCNSKKGNN